MTELINTQPIIQAQESIDDGVCLTLFVPETLDYFKGHFPDAPILAGVVQLDWAIQMGQKYLLQRAIHSLQLQVLKFQVVITPGMTLFLELKQSKANKFTFLYRSEKGVHASGRVMYEC